MSHVEADEPPAPAVPPPGDKLVPWNRERQAWDDGITGAMFGIMFAGACYPILAVPAAFLSMLAIPGGRLSLPSGGNWVCAAPGILFTSSVVCAFAALTIGCAVLLLCNAVVNLLRLHRHSVLIGILAGGLTGCIGVFPLAFESISNAKGQWSLLWFLLLPCLATLCGQIGGGWGIAVKQRTIDVQFEMPQFRLSGTFLFTTCVAAFMVFARWGLTAQAPWYGPLLVWLVFQAGTAWLVLQLLTRCGLRPRVGATAESSLK